MSENICYRCQKIIEEGKELCDQCQRAYELS